MGVAAVGVAVLAAGAPSAVTASSELTDAQQQVTLAGLDQQAVSLAHALADERDDVTVYIAGGRHRKDKQAAARAVRVDNEIDEISAAAPASLRHALATLPAVRRTALTGKGSALDANKAYSDLIGTVQEVSDQLAEQTPPAAAASVRAQVDLGHAVDQASATRGLLLAALSVPKPPSSPVYDPVSGQYVTRDADPNSPEVRTRDELSTAAQLSRVRELAALADFDQAAGPDARESLDATVSGPEVDTAEKYLTRLTDQPQLSASDLKTSPTKAGSALTARIDQMRGVESALGARQAKRFAALRDDAVTSLEWRVALTGALLLLTIGVGAAVARTLTRPLAVLRIGAARLAASPGTEEPIRFTGRNDEFAQVVRSINTLHSRVLAADARAAQHAVSGVGGGGVGVGPVGDRELPAAARAAYEARIAEVTARLDRLRHTVQSTFVNLSLRGLGLVERQLTVIEGLEEREQDPEELATLFKLDHMATVLRRHSENLLVLAGTEHSPAHSGPVPLVDVLRAAAGEIERYERVAIRSLPAHSQVAGFAADDISHLIAELLENATSFSPPATQVQLSGWLLESGEVMLSVQDEGIGMSAGRRTELNARLADPETYYPGGPDDDGAGLGLHVAALLAARHGVRVELREQKQGGIAAVVVLSSALLPEEPPLAPPHVVPTAGAAPTLNLPGSVAEANSNVLPTRSRYAIGADDHERTDDTVDAGDTVPVDEPTFTMRLPHQQTTEQTREQTTEQTSERVTERVTDKGLPKRTPKISRPAEATPRQRSGGVDADALRRRLGGFHQGAKNGRKDVEAEISEQLGTEVVRTDDAGDSVEEARS
ncbi:nitrate- and nitrite sensing domain-containing protein [Streptomyces sp. NPDC051320]|uniref:sensor histidine kinase n=1 Tax=Streptomyces sp. NPDC051320 TaxID=3154644 RepID=UPI00342915C8